MATYTQTLLMVPEPAFFISSSTINHSSSDSSLHGASAYELAPLKRYPTRRNDEKEPFAPPPWQRLQTWWNENVRITVHGKWARDNLALERTFLAYHRTSMALSLMAALVLQLQVLQHRLSPSSSFGYYLLGKPLAVVLVCAAISIQSLGTLRWWRWQRFLTRGKAMCGGGEFVVVGGLMMGVVIVLATLNVAVEVDMSWLKGV